MPLSPNRSQRTVLGMPSTVMAALGVSFAFSLFPWGKFALYPFKLFTTWVHECSHATMALLLGGKVLSVMIAPDTSGLTVSLLPAGVWRQALVSSAGYVGSSAVGCLLYSVSRGVGRRAHTIIWGIGILMVLSLVFWMRNLFGVVTVAALGTSLIWLGRPARGQWAEFLLALLAVQVGLNALFDIRVLYNLDPGAHSDAHTLATLFYLPAWFWATSWLLISLALMGVTVRRTKK